MPRRKDINIIDCSAPASTGEGKSFISADEFRDQYERRPLLEELREAGVNVEIKGELTSITWFDKIKVARKIDGDISVVKTCITFSPKTVKTIDATWCVFGAGNMDGRRVLLIKPSGEGDNNGFKLSIDEKGIGRIKNKKLLERIIAAGIKMGSYELCKAKGGFVAVPFKNESK